jgi:hypothetical protein
MARATTFGMLGLAGLLGVAPAANGQAGFRPRFAAQAPFAMPVGPGAGRQAAALADLDGDRRPDLVAIAPDADQVVVRLNDGDGSFAAPTAHDLAITPTAVAVADVASPAGAPDGVPDLLLGGDAGELQILPGLGGGAVDAGGEPLDLGDASEIVGLALGELDGVAGADVAVLDVDGVLALCNAAGTLAPCAATGLLPTGTQPIEILAGDFDGDGLSDVVVLDGVDQLVRPFFGQGGGILSAGNPINVSGEARDGAAVDMVVGRLDGDAIDDVVVVNSDQNFQFLAVSMLGSDRDRFRSLAFVIDFEAAAAAVDDFDGDGAADAIVGYDDGGLTVNLGNGTGALADPFIPVGTNTVGRVGLILAGDLDGDDAPDLVVIHGAGDEARALLNVTLPFCAGDCNADGTVTIEELLRGVRIVLGESDPRDCIALDVDGSLTVTVNELVAAVNGALDGCPAA